MNEDNGNEEWRDYGEEYYICRDDEKIPVMWPEDVAKIYNEQVLTEHAIFTLLKYNTFSKLKESIIIEKFKNLRYDINYKSCFFDRKKLKKDHMKRYNYDVTLIASHMLYNQAFAKLADLGKGYIDIDEI